ncbi:hypothetical protein R3P38DRAFT_3017141 [Favolaschia claudopus]|uniref:Uncharacterized protein n=1 Tax=Favolaschia claudopus TaxID=2862362 RepID=A0AAW0AIY9_9AGAR
MHLSLLYTVILLAIPTLVVACEGSCITDTTAKMHNNYNKPVACALSNIGQEIIDTYNLNSVPGSPTISIPTLLQPMTTCYNNISFDALETALFPHFFHGKCLDADGNEPDGCPDPDCPIVCGTPGSIVHFYSMWYHISYNTTVASFSSCADPRSTQYKTLQKRILAHLPKSKTETGPGPQVLRSRRSGVSDHDEASTSLILEEHVGSSLKHILARFPQRLEECCGGAKIPSCIWEKQMKKLVLSFP